MGSTACCYYVLLIVLTTLLLQCTPSATSISGTVSIKDGPPIHVTDEKFLSLGMDSNLIRDRWETFDFSSTRLITLAKGLAPTYLRLSGTDGDRMIFNKSISQFGVKGKPPFPSSTFSMTVDDWDKINQFCSNVGWDLMFGLNGQLRFTFNNRTIWNPTNAMDLLDYSIKRGYNKHLHFQLGNEPSDWPSRAWEVQVTGQQLAEDFKTLHKLLNTMYAGYFNHSVTVGPDISGITHPSSEKLLLDFLNNIDTSIIKATSFHHYYGGGKTVDTYEDVTRFDQYINFVNVVKSIVANSSQKTMPIWNTETSSTGYPSGSGLEEAFVANFMLVDHLGMSARMKLDVVMRQTFYGFWFALVDNDLLPRPTYWFAVLFKRLVGAQVLALNVNISGTEHDPKLLRLYAHCTSPKSNPGSVTVYGMNLFDQDVQLNFSKIEVEQYLLTTDYLSTKITYLNGYRLEMPNNATLPEMKPLQVDGSRVNFSAKSVGLYVLPKLKAKPCM